MLLTYSALAVLALSAAWGHFIVGLVAALFLCEAPFRLRRWRRTRRAFDQLPTYKKQQVVAAWWLAFGLAGLLAANWLSDAADRSRIASQSDTPAYGHPAAYAFRKQLKSLTLSTGGFVDPSQFA